MGVPKFFRWLAERYPSTLQRRQQGSSPSIDNLYLDMNGIIHNCTHANDAKVTASEDEMVHRIFLYIERLVRIANPQRVLFLAIDGVAPRAKMNQQRSRRFMAAKERQAGRANLQAESKAAREGELLPAEGLFDSNCITPGTPFMARLHDHLRFFIRSKMALDPAWQKLKVVYSGYDIPGEGEHKIMEFIRIQKLQRGPGKANMKHCLYGLDADLVMLSLASHEPHFCLLREVVAYGGKQRGQPSREVLSMKSDDFTFLHIGLLREYLEEEMRPPGPLPFEFDLERAIDDFVLLCILIGNDFLPHSPTLDIGEGAMDELFATYRDMLPELGGFLTWGGRIDHGRLEQYIERLARGELDTLIERAKDQEAFERRRGHKGPADGALEGPVDAMAANKSPLGHSVPLLGEDGGSGDSGSLALETEGPLDVTEVLHSAVATMMTEDARNLLLSGDRAAGLDAYKSRFYRKMDAQDNAQVRSIIHHYIEGLHWVMEYYYRGVPSWSWFYPFHYAPFLSDMVDLGHVRCTFDQAVPVTPYQQLLMVLPAASCNLLPMPLRGLMLDEQSPVKQFYPEDFRVDIEGKRADWEAVILLPFVDQEVLLAAFQKAADGRLSASEVDRNKVGQICIFEFDESSTESSWCKASVPAYAPDVAASRSKCILKDPVPALLADQEGFVPAIQEGCKYGRQAPEVGWPSLHILDFETELQRAQVNVLGIVSRKLTRVLKPTVVLGVDKAEVAANTLLGQTCYVRYPHLVEAKILSLAIGNGCYTKSPNADVQHNLLADAQAVGQIQEIESARRTLLAQSGIDAQSSSVYARVQAVEGATRFLDGTVRQKYAAPEFVPLELVLRAHPARAHSSLSGPTAQRLKPGDSALFLGLGYYGWMAEVLPGLHMVTLRTPGVSSVTALTRSLRALAVDDARSSLRGWHASYIVARKLGVDPSALGRITGPCRVTVGEKQIEVGLCMRSGTDLAVHGFARQSPDGKGLQYSDRAVELLRQYQQRFPWVAELCTRCDTPVLPAAEIFPELNDAGRTARVEDVKRWVDASPLHNAKLASSTSKVLSEAATQRATDVLAAAMLNVPQSTVTVEDVADSLLLPPLADAALTYEAAPAAVQLGEVVVSTSGEGGTQPPFGMLGVVVGVHGTFVELLCASAWPQGLDLEGRVPRQRGARMPLRTLLSLSTPPAKLTSTAKAMRSTTTVARVPTIPDGTTGFHPSAIAGRGRGVLNAPDALPTAFIPTPTQPLNPPPPAAALAAAAAASGASPEPAPTHQGPPPYAGRAPSAFAATCSQPAVVPDFLQQLLNSGPPASALARQAPVPGAKSLGTAHTTAAQEPAPLQEVGRAQQHESGAAGAGVVAYQHAALQALRGQVQQLQAFAAAPLDPATANAAEVLVSAHTLSPALVDHVEKHLFLPVFHRLAQSRPSAALQSLAQSSEGVLEAARAAASLTAPERLSSSDALAALVRSCADALVAERTASKQQALHTLLGSLLACQAQGSAVSDQALEDCELLIGPALQQGGRVSCRVVAARVPALIEAARTGGPRSATPGASPQPPPTAASRDERTPSSSGLGATMPGAARMSTRPAAPPGIALASSPAKIPMPRGTAATCVTQPKGTQQAAAGVDVLATLFGGESPNRAARSGAAERPGPPASPSRPAPRQPAAGVPGAASGAPVGVAPVQSPVLATPSRRPPPAAIPDLSTPDAICSALFAGSAAVPAYTPPAEPPHGSASQGDGWSALKLGDPAQLEVAPSSNVSNLQSPRVAGVQPDQSPASGQPGLTFWDMLTQFPIPNYKLPT